MKDFKTLKEKIQRGDASEEEMEQFRLYIERVALEEMQRSIVDPQVRDRSGEWRGVWAKIREKEHEQQEGTSHYLYRLGRVAAVVIAVALMGAVAMHFWRKETPQPLAASTIKMITGKNHIKLSDGTTVDLNEGSTLSYSADFGTTKERMVELDGEGFFDVTHNPGRPFRVKTGDVVTTVLGTAFNIKAYKEQAKVTVTVMRGKVVVGHASEVLGHLLPNEEITVNTSSLEHAKVKVNAERSVHWKSEYLILDNITMLEAARLISEHFKANVSLGGNKDLEQCHVTAYFLKGEPLKTVVSSVCLAKGLEYNMQGQSVTITGTCK